MEEEGTIKLKKTTMWKTSTFVLAVLLAISLFTGGFGIGGNQGTGAVINNGGSNNNGLPTGAKSVSAEDYVDSDDPFLGNENAELTIVEFSDFQCPFCSRAAPTVKQIIDEYGDKVKLVYNHFPLTSIHPHAQKAAEASECAHDQGMFWEYHDVLFANNQFLDTDSLKKYASDLGLDTEQFNECLDSGEKSDEVKQDLQAASNAGGQGTPYFIVGDVPLSGAQPYANFKQVIDAQL